MNFKTAVISVKEHCWENRLNQMDKTQFPPLPVALDAWLNVLKQKRSPFLTSHIHYKVLMTWRCGWKGSFWVWETRKVVSCCCGQIISLSRAPICKLSLLKVDKVCGSQAAGPMMLSANPTSSHVTTSVSPDVAVTSERTFTTLHSSVGPAAHQRQSRRWAAFIWWDETQKKITSNVCLCFCPYVSHQVVPS